MYINGKGFLFIFNVLCLILNIYCMLKKNDMLFFMIIRFFRLDKISIHFPIKCFLLFEILIILVAIKKRLGDNNDVCFLIQLMNS